MSIPAAAPDNVAGSKQRGVLLTPTLCTKGTRIMIDSTPSLGLGRKSTEMLRVAGIFFLSQLRTLGAVGAYVAVKRAQCKPSLNFLWGLESVISGGQWREVARTHRTSLLLALDAAERRE